MEVSTYADVRVEIARSGLTQRLVAEEMGYRPDEFSRLINLRDSIPTPEWVTRFQRAIEAVSARKVA